MEPVCTVTICGEALMVMLLVMTSSAVVSVTIFTEGSKLIVSPSLGVRERLSQRTGAAVVSVGDRDGVHIGRNCDSAERQHANCEGRGSPHCVVQITLHLTRIRLQLAIYFCLHRGKLAGKHCKLASAKTALCHCRVERKSGRIQPA